MNIQMLLSAAQGQNNPSSLQANASKTGVREAGLFDNALAKAALLAEGAEAKPQVSAQQGKNALASLAPYAELLQSLEAGTLDLDISAQELEALLEQSQDGLAAEATGLDEIAARLALLAEFDTLEMSAEGTRLQEGEALAAAQEVSLQQLRTALQSSEKVAELMQQTDTSQAEIAPLVQLTELARSMAASSAQTSTPAQGNDSSRGSLLDALATSQQAQPRLNDKGEQPIRPALDTTQLQRPVSEAMANSMVDSRLAGGSLPTSESSLAAGMQAQPSSQSQPSLVGLNTATSAPAQASISTPVTHQAWPQQLGQQLMQFTQRGGEQQIQMQIHPAELGPLSISLKVSEQGTQVHFLSAHAQVRQVIEQAIPQLREALAEQGISLGETSVGDQSDGQEFADQKSPSQPGTDAIGTAVSDSEGDAQASTTLAAYLEGRVDLYA
ncbi:flagellar hook-length control protein FliK [Vreelandella rituensis]|uniref:Flagellar hook-length control protein FliK n=1 Tax=Vreelandella rituensis TaxID=2282306 RepID=A0A368TRM5_9GAMM|nr:flagellar hook-length control protein FliK [Halomonas rituensis]RCV86986.1 flagellar hook-length control protein FliK [Halomonas rituensis]